MTSLYHYTCGHAAPDIRDAGMVLPGHKLPGAPPRLSAIPWAAFAWFTDLDEPIRDALGLTQELVTCDRAEYRFRALDDLDLIWWPTIRRTYSQWAVFLEAAPGARPAHWYVSDEPVPVIEAPRHAE